MSRGISEGKKVFVIDGFLRSIDQACCFDEIVGSRFVAANVLLTSLDFRMLLYNFAGLLRAGDARTTGC